MELQLVIWLFLSIGTTLGNESSNNKILQTLKQINLDKITQMDESLFRIPPDPPQLSLDQTKLIETQTPTHMQSHIQTQTLIQTHTPSHEQSALPIFSPVPLLQNPPSSSPLPSPLIPSQHISSAPQKQIPSFIQKKETSQIQHQQHVPPSSSYQISGPPHLSSPIPAPIVEGYATPPPISTVSVAAPPNAFNIGKAKRDALGELQRLIETRPSIKSLETSPVHVERDVIDGPGALPHLKDGPAPPPPNVMLRPIAIHPPKGDGILMEKVYSLADGPAPPPAVREASFIEQDGSEGDGEKDKPAAEEVKKEDKKEETKNEETKNEKNEEAKKEETKIEEAKNEGIKNEEVATKTEKTEEISKDTATDEKGKVEKQEDNAEKAEQDKEKTDEQADAKKKDEPKSQADIEDVLRLYSDLEEKRLANTRQKLTLMQGRATINEMVQMLKADEELVKKNEEEARDIGRNLIEKVKGLTEQLESEDVTQPLVPVSAHSDGQETPTDPSADTPSPTLSADPISTATMTKVVVVMPTPGGDAKQNSGTEKKTEENSNVKSGGNSLPKFRQKLYQKRHRTRNKLHMDDHTRKIGKISFIRFPK